MTKNEEFEINIIRPDERKIAATEAALRGLISRYDLTPYLFTRKINIQPFVIPHSHPVLTLNTRLFDDPDRLLCTFLHEQIHWFLPWERTRLAIAEFRVMYPDAPTGFPDGARDLDSTYLHLAVNWLELQAAARYLGREKAERIMREQSFYRWIYRTVLADEAEIGSVLARHELIIEPEKKPA